MCGESTESIIFAAMFFIIALAIVAWNAYSLWSGRDFRGKNKRAATEIDELKGRLRELRDKWGKRIKDAAVETKHRVGVARCMIDLDELIEELEADDE